MDIAPIQLNHRCNVAEQSNTGKRKKPAKATGPRLCWANKNAPAEAGAFQSNR
jgi:hypothetical protein